MKATARARTLAACILWWGKHNVKVDRAADGSMQVSRIPIPAMPEELRRVVEEMK
jgi:hypothetical protein